MTLELWLLLASLPVFGLYLGAQSLLYRAQYGVIHAATARDNDGPEGVVLRRADRALHNFQETWPVYIIAMLVAHLAAPGDALVLWGALIWLVSRVVYLPLYLFGVFGLRSLVWLIAGCGLCLVLVGVLF